MEEELDLARIGPSTAVETYSIKECESCGED